MQKTDERKVASMKRGSDFATQYPPASPPTNFTVHVDALNRSISAASDAAAEARRIPRQADTVAKNEARQTLRTTLVHLRDIAKGLAHDTPGVEFKFKVPILSSRIEVLLQAARQIRSAAAQDPALFITNGMPGAFLSELDAGIANVQQAVSGRALGDVARRDANKRLTAAIVQGDRAMAYLNGIYRIAFKGEPNMLAAWDAVRKIGGHSVRKTARTLVADATGTATTTPVTALRAIPTVTTPPREAQKAA